MRGRALALGGCIVAAFLALLAGLASAANPNDPNIDVSPTSYSFGSFCLGATSTAKTIKISNTTDPTNGQDLHVSSISRNGPSDFIYTNPAPATITPQEHVNFAITFKPQVRGSRSADFTITSDDPDNTHEHVLVSGSGIDRRLSADRSSISFGDQRVKTRSPTQSLVVRNTGGDTVTVTSIARRGANAADFLVTPPAPSFTIAPGNFKTVSVAFQPSGAGLRSAAIDFFSNACAGGKVSVGLVGTGIVPDVIVEPNPVEAGGSPSGKESKPVEVTLTNNGKAPLKITAIQVIGTDAADFSLKGLPVMPVTVPPAGTLAFQVTMTPSSEGLRSANINVLSDDPDTPAFTVPLRGTAGATSPPPSARPTTSRTPSPSPSQSVRQTSGASPQALAKPANDNLAVGMVVAGVVIVFGGLLFIRRFVAHDED